MTDQKVDQKIKEKLFMSKSIKLVQAYTSQKKLSRKYIRIFFKQKYAKLELKLQYSISKLLKRGCQVFVIIMKRYTVMCSKAV